MEQMTINFEGGLRARYPTICDVMRASLALSKRSQKAIAADMDMSPSELSRRVNADLNDNDTRVFNVADLDKFIKAVGNTLVIEWQIEGHMVSADDRDKRLLREFARRAPEILELMAQLSAGDSSPTA